MNSKTIIGIIIGLVVVLAVGAYVMKYPKMSAGPSANTVNTVLEPTIIQTSPELTAQAPQETAQVSLTSAGFVPATLTIKSGTKVEWTNNSGETATVNSAVHPTHLLFPFLNLGSFQDGGTLSAVFETPGTFKYHDHLNPTRFGTVIVE